MLSIDHIRTIARRQHQQGVACVTVEAPGFSVQIQIGSGQSPATALPSPSAESHAAAPTPNPACEVLKSHRLGIASFPAPLQVGQSITPGQVLLQLTVGSTIHEVTAPKHAQISAILVASGALVDWGMPLFKFVPQPADKANATASAAGEAP